MLCNCLLKSNTQVIISCYLRMRLSKAIESCVKLAKTRVREGSLYSVAAAFLSIHDPTTADGALSKQQRDLEHIANLEQRFDTCQKNTGIYIAHQSRKKFAVIAKKESIRRRLLAHQAVVVIDFKQKFQPQFSRETQAQYFGKRGISIFGATAIRKRRNSESDSTGDDEASTYYEVLYIIRACSDESQQDWSQALILLEACLAELHKETGGEITEVFIQSDGASNFSGTGFLLGP